VQSDRVHWCSYQERVHELVFFALLAPLVFTLVNFADKYIIEREVRDPKAMPVYAGIMAFLTGTTLWVITGFPVLPLHDAALVMFTGALATWGSALYFRAISSEEASSVIVLIQMQSLFVLVLSILFLSETLTLTQFIGFALILTAAVGISLKGGQAGRFRLSAAFFLLLLVDLMWASSIVLFKFVVSETAFTDVLAFESWGMALGGLALYLFLPPLRRAFHQSARTIKRRGLAMIFVNETVFVIAKLLTFTAVSLGPVALVSVLGSTQVFFGIALGWLLTTLLPHIYNENVTRANLLRKGALAAVMFGGILLVH
jgi:drug/metabolite transporter (DMT)-like permease